MSPDCDPHPQALSTERCLMARAGIAPVPHGCPAPGWSSGTGPGCPKESPQPPQGTNSCTLESIIFCRLLEKKYWEGLNLYCKCLHLGHLHACAHIVIITVCQLFLQYEDFRYLQLWRAFCSRPVQKNPKPFHLLASHIFSLAIRLIRLPLSQ